MFREYTKMLNYKKENWNIVNRKIKLALVGLGRVAQTHLEAIEKLSEHLDLVAVCDKNEDKLQKVTQRFNSKSYYNISDCLENTDADVVVLCTPSGFHSKQTILAAEHGKHIITEKPMATRWKDGIKMLEACEENNVRLFVVKQNRFNEPLQLLKKAIQENRFGKIYMANLNVFWTREQAYYGQSAWRGTWKFDGGAFMNQAAHYFDLLNWLIGPVSSIYSMTATLARNIEVEDTGIVAIKWRSGTLGSMNVTVLTYPKDREGSIIVLGEKGTVKIGGVALNKIEDWNFSESHPMDEEVDGASYSTDSVYGFGHLKYYQNIIDVFRGNAVPSTTGTDGLKALELLIAAYRSSRDNIPVHLPLEL